MTVSINQMLGGKKHGRRHKNGAVPLVGRMKSVTVNANSLFFFVSFNFFFLFNYYWGAEYFLFYS
jgi:hypothetical protein